jgi:transposase-like protein
VALYQSRSEATMREVAADLGINPDTLFLKLSTWWR